MMIAPHSGSTATSWLSVLSCLYNPHPNRQNFACGAWVNCSDMQVMMCSLSLSALGQFFLENPVRSFRRAGPIRAWRESVAFVENLCVRARRMLIAAGIRRRRSDGVCASYICHVLNSPLDPLDPLT